MDGVENGLTSLKGRMERRSRTIPPARAPKAAVVTEDPPEVAIVDSAVVEAPIVEPKPVVIKPPTARKAAQKRVPETEITGGPPMVDEREYANMTLRVRRSLDMRVADLVDDARRQYGFKSSKAELMEMLMSDLPTKLTSDLLARWRSFREVAPRP